MDYKSLPAFTKEFDIETRTVTGIFAVHGNRDSYGDISHPGAFAKTFQERTPRTKFLWNHDFWGGPPTAVIEDLYEIEAGELPDKVIAIAPDATGGAVVKRRYLKNERAQAIFEAVVEGATDEMSYCYDAIRVEYVEEDDNYTRHLKESRLWEISDVIFGANNATAASKQFLPDDVLFAQMTAFINGLKGEDPTKQVTKELEEIGQMLFEMGAISIESVKDEPDTDPEPEPAPNVDAEAEVETEPEEDVSDTDEEDAAEEEQEAVDETAVDNPEDDEQSRAGDDSPPTLFFDELEILELESALYL